MSKYEFNGNNNQIQINESPEYGIQNNAATYSKEELEKVLEQLSNLPPPKRNFNRDREFKKGNCKYSEKVLLSPFCNVSSIA